jgi:hypothetical protein
MTLRFTTWRNCGLGIMVCPPLSQAGIIFLIWSVVILWGESPDDPDKDFEEMAA